MPSSVKAGSPLAFTIKGTSAGGVTGIKLSSNKGYQAQLIGDASTAGQCPWTNDLTKTNSCTFSSSDTNTNFPNGTTITYTAIVTNISNCQSTSTKTVTIGGTTATCSGLNSKVCFDHPFPANVTGCGNSTQERVCNNGVWGEWGDCNLNGCTCKTGYVWSSTSKSCVGIIPTCSGPTSQSCTPKLPDNAVSCSQSTQDRVCTNGKWGSWNPSECKPTLCLCLVPDFKWDEAIKSCVATDSSMDLRTRLTSMMIPAADIDGLINFAITHGVPYGELTNVLDNVVNMPKSDPLSYLEAFSVAYYAVNNNLLDAKYAPIVDYLRNGQIDVAIGTASGLYAGVYENWQNRYVINEEYRKILPIDSVFAQSIMLHELVHAYQDATHDNRPIQELEVDAYLAGNKYNLLESGFMKKADGGVAINIPGYDLNYGSNKIDAHDFYRTWILLETIRNNAQSGKNELNNITASGKLLSSMTSNEVVEFANTGLGFISESSKKNWRDMTKNGDYQYYFMNDKVFYNFVAKTPHFNNGVGIGVVK
jgi:hypothetical protein